MLLLLGGHNCIHGITYKVLSNIKLKWLHTQCTSPSEPLFSPSLPPVPLCCKVHIEVWRESVATDTSWVLSASGAAVVPRRAPAISTPFILRLASLLASFRRRFSLLKSCARHSFPLFSARSPWKGFEMHLSQRQAFYTLPLTSRGQAPLNCFRLIKATQQSFYGVITAPLNLSPSSFQ